MIVRLYSIGKEQRNSLYKGVYSPGPGTYNLKPMFKGPKYHFGGRQTMSMTNLTPGPAQYNPDYKQSHKSIVYKYTMPGRGESLDAMKGPPGPGAYESKSSKLNKGGKFGKDQHRSLSLSHNEHVPGPGAYNENERVAASKHPTSPKYT